MAATVTWYDYTSTNGATETATTNANFLSIDAHDTGTSYQTNKISVPPTGTTYSFERIIRAKWTDTYNTIDTVKFWKSGGTPPTNVSINAAESATATTPTDSASSVATSAVPETEGAALSITTSGSSPNVVTYYIYLQLVVPSTVTTPGDIATQTYTLKYFES